jgi:signal transduction histidine kinase
VAEAARTHLPAGVRIQLDPSDGDVPPVAADEAQLRQVLDNLLDNAIKYSPAGGDIQLTVDTVDRAVRFSVADGGLGIPPLEQERIFEKFYRLDPDMTGGIGGTGLGLYIARELVRRVGGRIWVEANEGGGSVFHVEIPAATADLTQTGQLAASRP